MKRLFHFKEIQETKYHFPLRNDIIYSFMYLSLHGQRIMQMFPYHESLKIQPKEINVTRNMNMYNTNL
jgi:hypothetical protein